LTALAVHNQLAGTAQVGIDGGRPMTGTWRLAAFAANSTQASRWHGKAVPNRGARYQTGGIGRKGRLRRQPSPAWRSSNCALLQMVWA